MFPEDKVIYSWRHSRVSFRLDGELTVSVDTEEGLKRFQERWADSRLEANSERIKKSEVFIERAKRFAFRHRVDIDIVQKLYYIQVNLIGISGPYGAKFTRELVEIMGMCDRILVWRCKKEEDGATISLLYDTHDFYFGDVLVNHMLG